VRYWAATGCLILGDRAAPARAKLQERLADEWTDVRVVAAESLAHLGGAADAAKVVVAALKSANPHEALAAQNTLEYMWRAGHVPLAAAQDAVRGLTFGEPGNRIPQFLLDPTGTPARTRKGKTP
jgi:HEAT repeat protein